MHRGMMGEQGRGAMMRHGDDRPDGRGWGGQQGWGEGPQGWHGQGQDQQGYWQGQGWPGQGQQGDWRGQGWQGPDAEGGEDEHAEQGGAPMDHQRQTQPDHDADD